MFAKVIVERKVAPFYGQAHDVI